MLFYLDSVVHDQILRKVKHIPSTDADLIDEHVFQVWTGQIGYVPDIRSLGFGGI